MRSLLLLCICFVTHAYAVGPQVTLMAQQGAGRAVTQEDLHELIRCGPCQTIFQKLSFASARRTVSTLTVGFTEVSHGGMVLPRDNLEPDLGPWMPTTRSAKGIPRLTASDFLDLVHQVGGHNHHEGWSDGL